MIRRQRHRESGGFTLIEVVVAMFVIAIGLGALLNTLTSSAKSVEHLRDKSFAEWVALNHISETRLARPRPGLGVTTGEIEFAGKMWRWRQEIVDPEVPGIQRIDVAVAPASTRISAEDESSEDFPALATAHGFLGTAVSAPSGIDPDWGLPPPRGPGPP